MIAIQLDKVTLKKLLNIRRTRPGIMAEKALAVILSSEGNSIPSIAKQLKRHHHTVRDWLKRYQEHGIEGFDRKYSPGRPSTRKQEIEPFIKSLIDDPPETYGYQRNCWTLEMLRCEYEKYSSKKTSLDSIKRSLKDLGYSYKKAKAAIPDNAPTKDEKLVRINEISAEIKQFISDSEIETDVFAIDESHFSTQPYLPRGWFKKRYSNTYTYSEKKGEFFYFRCITNQGWEFLLEKRKIRQQ